MRFLPFLRLRRHSLWADTLEGLGLGVQSGLDRGDEASLRLFVAVGFIVALWVACHGEAFLWADTVGR